MPDRSVLGVACETNGALADVQQQAYEYGKMLSVHLRAESNVVRDEYNSIKTSNFKDAPISIYAFPLEFNPTDKQLMDAGIREKVDAIAYTPMKDWTDLTLTYEDIETIRSTVIFGSDMYSIKDKALYGPFGDTWLYIVLGLTRR